MMPAHYLGRTTVTRSAHNGFTLVELVLYISATVVLLLVLASAYSMVTLARLKSEVIAEVEQQGAFVMERIEAYVKEWKTIVAPAAGTAGPSLTMTIPGYTAIFDVDASGVMRLKINAANPVSITNDSVIVSNLAFQNLSRSGTPGVVRASFTISYAGGSGRQELTYSRTFYVSASVRPKL